jgi:hypothetical protein
MVEELRQGGRARYRAESGQKHGQKADHAPDATLAIEQQHALDHAVEKGLLLSLGLGVFLELAGLDVLQQPALQNKFIREASGLATAEESAHGEGRRVVAVIGDGAMTAGMAFEALNNAGVSMADMLVVLNDNDMSISPPVGALNRCLARLMSGKFYAKAREGAKSVLKNTPLWVTMGSSRKSKISWIGCALE